MSPEHEREEMSGPDLAWFVTGHGYSNADAAEMLVEMARDRVRQDSQSVRAWLKTHGDRWPRNV